MGTARTAALAAAFAALASPAAATAAPGFVPGVTAAPPAVSIAPGAVVDGDGATVAVWEDFATRRVVAAVRPAGGAFGPAEPLSPAGNNADEPRVVAHGSGAVVVAYRLNVAPAHYDVQAVVRRPGAGFGAPQTLSGSGLNAHAPRLWSTPDGGVAAIFSEAATLGSRDQIRIAEMAPGSSAFGPSDTLSDPSSTGANVMPHFAQNARGDTVVIWSRYNSSTTSVPESRIRRPGGAFAPVQTHTVPSRLTCSPHAGVDAAGNATAVWELSNDLDVCGTASVLHVASAGAGAATFGGNTSFAGPLAADPRLVVDRRGTAVVAYREGAAAAAKTRIASRPAGGSFGAPHQDLGPLRGTPALTLGPQGRPLANWRRTDADAVVRLYGSDRGADGGAFGAPVPLGGARTARADDPRFASDAVGNAAIGWLDGSDPNNPAVMVGGYDAAGPLIAGVQPPSGPTGDSNPFSVTAADALSAVSEFRWTFGDGGFGRGASGKWLYERPGAYEVSVTAADTLGNPSSATAVAQAVSPALSRVSLRPTRFAVAPARTPTTGLAARAARKARGTTIRFRMSLRGRVRVEILRALPGRRRGSRCVTPRSAPRGRRCTRLVRRMTLRRVAAPGSRRVKFSGRVGRRVLVPGSYRMRLRTVDAAGNLSAPVERRFTVVR